MSDYRIWKYQIPVTDEQTLSLPRGRVLSCKQQGRDPLTLTMWVHLKPNSLNPDNVKDATLRVRIVGTGNPCDSLDDFVFLETVLASNGLVWHVFFRWEEP